MTARRLKRNWPSLSGISRSIEITLTKHKYKASQKFELSGTIKLISETQTFPSGFSKRQFVVTTAEDKYPQDIALEFVKDNCDRLDSYRAGDSVKVDFDIRGNEYNGKHFVQLSAWKIEKTGEQREPQGARSSEYGQREATRGSGTGMPKAPPVDDFDDSSEIPF